MDDRLIQAFYYALGGIALGITLALAWSFHINSQTNAIHIILITTLISGFCGFLFPDLVPYWFKTVWNFLR